MYVSVFIGYSEWLVCQKILLTFTTDLFVVWFVHAHFGVHFMSGDVCILMLILITTLNNNFVEIVNQLLIFKVNRLLCLVSSRKHVVFTSACDKAGNDKKI